MCTYTKGQNRTKQCKRTQDCGSILRSWFVRVIWPNFERAWDWWKKSRVKNSLQSVVRICVCVSVCMCCVCDMYFSAVDMHLCIRTNKCDGVLYGHFFLFFFFLVLNPHSYRAKYSRNAYRWRCSNKVARKRLARRHSRNGPWTHERWFEVDVFVCWEWEWLLLLRVCFSFFLGFQRPNLSTRLS